MEEHAGFMSASDECPTYKKTQKSLEWYSFRLALRRSLGGSGGLVGGGLGRSGGSGWKRGAVEVQGE